jgi:hypothetical protein
VVLSVLCLALITPLLGGMMFETADGTLHLYRTITLRHALSEGDLWVRYVPGMVYGYGSPLFTYYSPLSLYPALGLELVGFTPVQAWLLSMAGYWLLAAGGLYALARRWLPPAATLVAALAYAAAPYTAYDVLWRGTVSEIASLALLPWVMAAMHALATRPTRGRFALVAISVALFMPMHNVITLHSAALLAAFGLLLAATSPERVRTLFRIGVAGALGAALCAFFWLPAITETSLVKIDGVTANLPEIDVTRNLAPIADAFALPPTIDPNRQQPPVAIALGWPALALGLVGLVGGWRARQRALTVFCLLGIAVLVFMNTPASAVVWRTIPLIQYSQFPTRLIGPASLLLAVLAGFGMAWLLATLRLPILRGLVYTVSLGALLVYAVPYLYRIPLPDLDPRTIIDAQNYERTSGYIGTSSFAEYVPRWAETLPDPNALIERFAESSIIPRLAPPEGVTVERAAWHHTRATLTLTAAQEAALVFDWFYLPNWVATLDGQPLTLSPNPQDGRIRLTLPAGTHTLDIALGRTGNQALADALSLAAVGGLLMLAIAWPRLSWAFGRTPAPRPQPQDPARLRPFVLAALVGLSVWGLKVAVFDRFDTPLRAERFATGTATALEFVTDANIADQLTLIGYDAPTRTLAAGDALRYELVWSARAPMPEDLQIIVKLLTPDGVRVAQVDDLAPAGLGTRNWLPGYYLVDAVNLPVPLDTPPGTYRAVVEVFRLSDRQTLPVINAQGNPEGVSLSLGEVTLTPAQPLATQPVILARTEALGLVLATGLPETVNVGQDLDLNLTWLAQRDLTAADRVTLEWARDGQTLAETDLTASLSYAGWPAGRVYTARHRLYVPGDLTAGDITPTLVWGDARYALPTARVTTPLRTFDAPDGMIDASEAVWANGLTLLGHLQNPDGTLVLVWRAESPQTQPLRRFAHLVDANGQIAHVTDGAPADWSRPVTGWMVGEIVLDPLPVPPSSGQTVRLGWYDPRTGTRLTIGSGDSFDLLILP